MVLVSAALLALPARADSLTPDQQRAHDIYKELVEIDTTTATGDTRQAAEAMAARLKAAGFADADVQVFSPAPRKGNLVARLHGTGARKPILLVAHLDVVPALRSDWSVDPFKLTEQDGYYYARGSSDDKYMAASFIANLIRYKNEGYKPDRDIIVALETDEEILDRDALGIQWLLEEPSRPDRCRVRAERGRRRRPEGRQGDPQLDPDQREGLDQLPARGHEQRRPLLGAAQGQRDLSAGRRAGAAREVRFSAAPERDDARLLRTLRAARDADRWRPT